MTTLMMDILALATVALSVLVITARSPVVAVMYLIGVFVLAACYLVTMGIVFIGLSYLIVYVGAVAVLFLFVIMMLNVRLSEVTAQGAEYTKNLPLGTLVGSLFLYELLALVPAQSGSLGELSLSLWEQLNRTLIGVQNFSSDPAGIHLLFPIDGPDALYTSLSQIQALGVSLYTYGSLWLLVVSVILLLAMMGPIALCMRSRPAVGTSLTPSAPRSPIETPIPLSDSGALHPSTSISVPFVLACQPACLANSAGEH